ncbi:MAG: class II aldolase [Rhodospirillaceae bacterium]|nr:class II aldolase [Rhodospirillaceae bacterium]
MNQLQVDFKVDRSTMSDTEWDLRVQLAGAYRLVDHFDWTELIYGHLTARIPGAEPHFLINPFGLNYDEVTASNLVKIDVDGNIIDDTPFGVNHAGFVIHSAVHMAHSEQNQVVMHTHTRAGMAVAGIEEGLLPISMFATTFHKRLAYHDYEGPSLFLDERQRLLDSLGEHRAMVLKNHGLLTVGRTVPETFLRLYRLERACQIQVDAGAAGTPSMLGDNIATKSGNEVDGYAETFDDSGYGQLEFAALMRKLDKIDASYRD